MPPSPVIRRLPAPSGLGPPGLLLVLLPVLLPALLGGFVIAALDSRAAADEPPAVVREAQPELYYVPDDAGRLVPVPGFRYRDFVEMLRLKEGLPGLPEAPPAVLEQVAARLDLRGTRPGGPPGDARETAADAATGAGGPAPATCPVEVELAIRQSRPGWVTLPVEFAGLMLAEPPRYQGPGRMLLAVGDPPAGAADAARGYRLWLSGSAGAAAGDTLHRVSLTGAVPLDAAPFQETVNLALPRATASRIDLRSWRDDPAVVVQPRPLPPRVERADGGGSSVTLLGLAGPVKVTVGERDAVGRVGVVSTPASAALPSAAVESVVRIDGRTAFTQAVIRIEQLAAGATTLRVRLPARAEIRAVQSPAVLVGREESAGGPLAVIRVDRDAEGRAAVELECERPVDAGGTDPFDPLGFAVEGVPAWRQTGRASVVVEGDWQVTWDAVDGTRRVDAPPGPPTPGFVAAFAYEAQPARLPLRVRPRASRIVVEPEYRYAVSSTRVALDARLRISARGAPVEGVEVAVEGWEVEDVGPASVVDVGGVTTEGGRCKIPFVQPLSGDTVIEIRGTLAVERDAPRVAWRMPAPRCDLLAPATVVIVPQSDIELVPDAVGLEGLVRQVAPAALRPDAERFTLVYRLDGDGGRFAATRRFLPRRIDATTAAQADIDDTDTIVRETIRFDVAHVPLEFVTLVVPATVAQAGTLEVRQNSQLLNPVPEATAPGQAGTDPAERPAGGDAVRLRAMLSAPLLGAGELTVQYTLPTPALRMETTLQYELPLVLPGDVRPGRQTVGLTTSDSVTVEPRGDDWKRDIAAQGAGTGRTWTAVRPQERMPLALSARRPTPLGQTVVDAAWLQTRLLGDRREDVYAYAITTSAESLALTLPRQRVVDDPADRSATEASVDVRLDGEPVPGAVRPDGRVVIDLPRRNAARAWLLEIVVGRQRSGLLEMVGAAARLPSLAELEPPRFPEGTLERRFYWELVVEADEHPLGRPARWTSQQRWGWDGLTLRQAPVVSRERLRGWLAAAVAAPGSPDDEGRTAPSPDMPTAGARAVYSGVGPPGAARIWIVPTWLLVLAASGPVLGLALTVLHRPRLRSPGFIVAAGAAASLFAAVFPDTAPLVAQAAIPGGLLAVLAGGVRWLVNRGGFASGRPAPPPVSASSITQPAPSLIVTASSESAADGTAPTVRKTP